MVKFALWYVLVWFRLCQYHSGWFTTNCPRNIASVAVMQITLANKATYLSWIFDVWTLLVKYREAINMKATVYVWSRDEFERNDNWIDTLNPVTCGCIFCNVNTLKQREKWQIFSRRHLQMYFLKWKYNVWISLTLFLRAQLKII